MSPRARHAMDKLGTVLLVSCLALALLPLASILWLVISHGAGAISFSFFVNRPAPVGEAGGGMGNAILGTLEMVAMASVIAIPLGVLTGVFVAEQPKNPVARAAKYLTDVLSGVPSIVMGVVAWGLLVKPFHGFSGLAGGVALAILAVPTITRTTEEFIKLVPRSLREASLALGAPQWRTTLQVVIPAARAGLVTGILLAIARISGETAPLLFTALGNQFWNFSPTKPMAALPLQIFNFAISPYDDWHAQAWAGAFVLTV
ncbi:MAG TPA: phosphate ABC transporter permease PstA, partial [bacterium]|nr:phosphate ABC transporter permease PstA [bacterium]